MHRRWIDLSHKIYFCPHGRWRVVTCLAAPIMTVRWDAARDTTIRERDCKRQPLVIPGINEAV